MKTVILIGLICSLYFAYTQGNFHSVILSFLNLNPSALLSEQGFPSLPIYVYSLATIGALVLTTSISWIFTNYLKHVASLMAIREKIEGILASGNTHTNEIITNKDGHLIEEYAEKIRISQKNFIRQTNAGEIAVSLGFISLTSSYFGNFLDLAYGLGFFGVGIFFLHKAAFLFVNSILVKRAEMRYILKRFSLQENSQQALNNQSKQPY